MLHLKNAPGHIKNIISMETHRTFREHLYLVSKRLKINLHDMYKASIYKWIDMALLHVLQITGITSRCGSLWDHPVRLQAGEHTAQVTEINLIHFGSTF